MSRDFKQVLSTYLPPHIDLVINQNRSTFISLIRNRLSVHEVFLQAPESVLQAIANFVKGKKKKETNRLLRSYIQMHIPTLDYREKVQSEAQGSTYDLQKIYDELNLHYFDSSLDLNIGWFGVKKMRRTRITFGQYIDALKLVKIHKMLDDVFYPLYFVSFIVYHEMLHSVVPGYHDERGYFRIHGSEFKRRERLFHDYQRAIEWQKRNREKIFGWA